MRSLNTKHAHRTPQGRRHQKSIRILLNKTFSIRYSICSASTPLFLECRILFIKNRQRENSERTDYKSYQIFYQILSYQRSTSANLVFPYFLLPTFLSIRKNYLLPHRRGTQRSGCQRFSSLWVGPLRTGSESSK